MDDSIWAERVFAASRNSTCGHLFHSHPVDCYVARFGDRSPLTFLAQTGVEIIRQDLRAMLEPHFSKRFRTGRVMDSNGGLLSEWTSFRDETPALVRGGSKSQAWLCPTCKKWIYYPMGKWYILAKDIPSDPVFGTDMGGVIVTNAIWQSIIGTKLSKVACKRIPVNDQPKDGFPPEISETPIDLQRKSPGLLERG
ncbi:MAG: hypothetical protein R3C01_16870 [Planctomycetaceae bacterium]